MTGPRRAFSATSAKASGGCERIISTWYNGTPATPRPCGGDAILGLQRVREKGWTRYIGYSGDGEAARLAVTLGVFDTLQTSINIADQEAIELTLPLARARQMGVIAKRPTANAA